MQESRLATAPDGAPIAYRSYGQGSPAILFSNGIGCNQAYVDHAIRAMAQKHQVVIWDYRGHVDSPAPDDTEDLSIDLCMQDMRAVAQAAGLADQDLILAGFSMGVQISLEYLRRWPEQVRGLVFLLGTHEYPLRSFFHMGRMGEVLVPGMLATVRRLGFLKKVWTQALAGPWVFPAGKLLVLNAKAARKEDFESWRAHLKHMDPEVFFAWGQVLADHSTASVLPDIRIPCLVVAGDKDNFTPIRVVRTMAAQIPTAEWFKVEGGSHGGLFEFPERINARVMRFLAEHFSGKIGTE